MAGKHVILTFRTGRPDIFELRMNGTIRLLLFPGLAADSRMLYPQADLPYRIEFPELPAPRRDESLVDYARKIEIPSSESVVLGGVSMGAMIALEIARTRPCRGVLMIASSRNVRMVPPLAKWLSGILKVTPNLGDKRRLPAWPLFVQRLGPLQKSDRILLAEAMHAQPIDRIREFVRMVATWKGVEDIDVPVFHIHGDADQVIPLRFVKPDVVIKGGGHALNMSHSREVNQYARTFIDSLMRPPE